MSELKECPFCGHTPKLMTDNYEDKHVYWPQCLDPDCIMSESASTWPTKAAAIAAWNTRPTPASPNDTQGVLKAVTEYDLSKIPALVKAARMMLNAFERIASGVCECNWRPETCKYHKATSATRDALAAATAPKATTDAGKEG